MTKKELIEQLDGIKDDAEIVFQTIDNEGTCQQIECSHVEGDDGDVIAYIIGDNKSALNKLYGVDSFEELDKKFA